MRNEKLRKVVTMLTIIATIATLISMGLNFLIPKYLSYKFHNDVSDASSIGIIGGADGPTAIFLSSQSYPYLTVTFPLLSIAGMLYLFFAKNETK